MVKNLPAVQETLVRSLGQEAPLEEGMATHSSILAWRIPWTEDLVGYSPQGHRELDTIDRLTRSLSLLYIRHVFPLSFGIIRCMVHGSFGL